MPGDIIGPLDSPCYCALFREDVFSWSYMGERSGTMLAALLKTSGMTHEKLARAIGVSTKTISVWKRNKAAVDPEVLPKLRLLVLEYGVPITTDGSVFRKLTKKEDKDA